MAGTWPEFRKDGVSGILWRESKKAALIFMTEQLRVNKYNLCVGLVNDEGSLGIQLSEFPLAVKVEVV